MEGYSQSAQLALTLPPASRRADHATSAAAGEAVQRRASALHNQILDCFDEFGRLTDEQLEHMPCFAGLAPSTVRKRRSELLALGKLKAVGVVLNSRGRTMTVWSAT